MQARNCRPSQECFAEEGSGGHTAAGAWDDWGSSQQWGGQAGWPAGAGEDGWQGHGGWDGQVDWQEQGGWQDHGGGQGLATDAGASESDGELDAGASDGELPEEGVDYAFHQGDECKSLSDPDAWSHSSRGYAYSPDPTWDGDSSGGGSGEE